MTRPSLHQRPPASARLLRALIRRRVRGSTRLTLLLAHRISVLHSMSVEVDRGSVFVDLREPSCHGLLAGWIPEPQERACIAKLLRPGDTAVDVGAHWGLYTVLCAALVGQSGRVLAIEPCPRVLPQLRKTVATLSNITLIETALSDSIGSATLAVPQDASMASLLQNPARRAASANYSVATTTLDHVLAATGIDAADFVKCDVEGAEALVLRGARQLLNRRQAPTILFENNPAALRAAGQRVETVAEWLASLSSARYRLYLPRRGALEPLETIPEAFANILAVPEARRGAP